MRKNRKQNRRKYRKTVLIYCDGITEKYYLESMKNELNRDKGYSYRIEPQLNCSDAFEDVMEKLKELLNPPSDEPLYDLIFYVRDMDTCYKQNKIQEYNRLKNELLEFGNAKDRLFFIESRPCVEFWFFLHFLKTDRLYKDCSELKKELKSHLKNYKTSEDYAKRVYNDLEAYLQTAVQNADELNRKKRVKGEQYSYTKMNELYKKIKAL